MAVEKFGASKTDVIVKLVLVFFISLLSFSIGTFVGKKFSDNQHKISQLEPQGTKIEEDAPAAAETRDVASVNPESTEVKPKDALNDEEIKKLAEEFVSNDDGKKGETKEKEAPATHAETTPAEHAEAAVKEAKEAPAAQVVEHPVAAPEQAEHKLPAKKSAPSEVAVRVAAGKTPEPEVVAETAAKSRIPQSLPTELANSAVGKFTVQVASFPTEEEAQKSAGGLKEKGFSAFYVAAKIKEKTWFRVSVGVFETQKEAESYRTDLLSRSKIASAIVQKITK